MPLMNVTIARRCLTRRAPVAAAAGLLAVSLGLMIAVTGCASAAGAPGHQQRAAAAFLRVYARPDGRVVRINQGGDTVSEGQAYGMLLAEVTGNESAFGRIWGWTHAFACQANRPSES
jgi:endoglucanase